MRRVYAVLGWLLAALVATGVGLAAVGTIGNGIVTGTSQPLSEHQVRDRLAQATGAASPTPSGSRTATPSGTSSPSRTAAPSHTPSASRTGGAAEPSVLSGPGGTLVAHCRADGTVLLDSWSPTQGYTVEDIDRGPARHATIQFEADDDEFEATIGCTSGHPHVHWRHED